MPEATFYVLSSTSPQERLAFACRLIEKVYRNGSSCFVVTDNELQNRKMDDLLWTFRPGSFVPHQVYRDEAPAFQQTILIGHGEIPQPWRRMVVNLSSSPPNAFEYCERILEILDNSEETRQSGRNRFRLYRDKGFATETHTL